MRKKRLHTILPAACIVLLTMFANGTAEEAQDRTVDYELMSALIGDEYESEFSLILINSETEPWCLAGGLAVLRDEWPQLKAETIDALIVANSGSTMRLSKKFRLPVEYRLVAERDYMRVLNNDAGEAAGNTIEAGSESSAGAEAYASISGAVEPDWDSFDRAFPDAQGYLTFSKIGFDEGRTQALVIFSNAYRCSGSRARPATRRIAFFMKREGAWELFGVSGNIRAMR